MHKIMTEFAIIGNTPFYPLSNENKLQIDQHQDTAKRNSWKWNSEPKIVTKENSGVLNNNTLKPHLNDARSDAQKTWNGIINMPE